MKSFYVKTFGACPARHTSGESDGGACYHTGCVPAHSDARTATVDRSRRRFRFALLEGIHHCATVVRSGASSEVRSVETQRSEEATAAPAPRTLPHCPAPILTSSSCPCGMTVGELRGAAAESSGGNRSECARLPRRIPALRVWPGSPANVCQSALVPLFRRGVHGTARTRRYFGVAVIESPRPAGLDARTSPRFRPECN